MKKTMTINHTRYNVYAETAGLNNAITYEPVAKRNTTSITIYIKTRNPVQELQLIQHAAALLNKDYTQAASQLTIDYLNYSTYDNAYDITAEQSVKTETTRFNPPTAGKSQSQKKTIKKENKNMKKSILSLKHNNKRYTYTTYRNLKSHYGYDAGIVLEGKREDIWISATINPFAEKISENAEENASAYIINNLNAIINFIKNPFRKSNQEALSDFTKIEFEMTTSKIMESHLLDAVYNLVKKEYRYITKLYKCDNESYDKAENRMKYFTYDASCIHKYAHELKAMYANQNVRNLNYTSCLKIAHAKSKMYRGIFEETEYRAVKFDQEMILNADKNEKSYSEIKITKLMGYRDYKEGGKGELYDGKFSGIVSVDLGDYHKATKEIELLYTIKGGRLSEHFDLRYVEKDEWEEAHSCETIETQYTFEKACKNLGLTEEQTERVTRHKAKSRNKIAAKFLEGEQLEQFVNYSNKILLLI